VHGPTSGRPTARRTLAALLAFVTALSLLIVAPAVLADPAPPPNPTDGQLSAAARAQNAVAAQVGQLSGQVAQKQEELQQARGRAELAEQKYANAIAKLRDAQAAAVKAQAGVKAAQAQVDSAHAKFVQYVQAAYMSGEVEGTAGNLLTAQNPNDLLQQSALEQYQQAHQADAIGALQGATVAKSNADAAARAAVQKRQRAKDAADQQKQIAFQAVTQAKVEEAALKKSLDTTQANLEATRTYLARLQGQRAAYQLFEQRRRERLAREAAARAAARAAAAAAAAARRAAQGGGSNFSPGPSAPSGGSWSAKKGQAAANRALSQLGMPYAWAGGGVGGPSYGVCDGSNGAPNDCNISGYDCSGLVLYAWGKYWDHYAATQYSEAGHVHPSPGNLQAGDLLFWSSNGTVAGIHHVALAIGGGRMVEAPYSGGVVQIESIYEYGNIDFTTRPLT
jgi:peptidoglycan DL-endopeptidase RipA